jgi:nucleotide-binding universal stress UspA family protein
MKNSTLLIAIGKDCPDADLAKKLETARTMSAHVAVLIVSAMPQFGFYAYGMTAYGSAPVTDQWHQTISAEHAVLETKAESIRNLLRQHDTSGDVNIVYCEPASIGEAVAQRALLCDLAFVADDLRENDTLFRQVVYGLLFRSPIGVVLNDVDGVASLTPKRVFVAWNTSLQTARAAHQALPILRQAQEVIIATFDPVMTELQDGENPGSDAAKWLSHHGCNVTVQQYPSGDREIGDCILQRSKETGSDLVVMGAYGHSRMRQGVFGGTTRTMIDQTEQLVLLAHS